MNKLLTTVFLVSGFLGVAATGYAQPVEFTRVCSLYGSGYHYIPGTDICLNEQTGQTKQQTAGGTWTAMLPTSTPGKWVNDARDSCGSGRLVRVGTYRPTDFKPNAFDNYQVAPFGLRLQRGEYISKVIMSGGFYDPLQPQARNTQLGSGQLCLRFADPTFFTSDMGSAPTYPAFCGTAPLGCVSNSQIVGAPAPYEFPVLGTPIVRYNTDVNGRAVDQPMTCGSQLVVTTGMGRYNPTIATDPSQPGVNLPAAGSLTTWVCVMSVGQEDRDR